MTIAIISFQIVTIVSKMVGDAPKELSSIIKWMKVNKLSPNPKKAEFMIIRQPLKTRSPRDKMKSFGHLRDEILDK